jgi:hypothetical protein
MKLPDYDLGGICRYTLHLSQRLQLLNHEEFEGKREACAWEPWRLVYRPITKTFPLHFKSWQAQTQTLRVLPTHGDIEMDNPNSQATPLHRYDSQDPVLIGENTRRYINKRL